MDYALNVAMDYPVKTDYPDYEGSEYSGFGDKKKRKVIEGGNRAPTVKLSREELKKLLEPLSKDQLVALLIDAHLNSMVRSRKPVSSQIKELGNHEVLGS